MSRKFLYRFLQVLCIIYIFIPEPTDLFFPLGWLDEATVVGFAVYLQKKIKELDGKAKPEDVVEID